MEEGSPSENQMKHEEKKKALPVAFLPPAIVEKRKKKNQAAVDWKDITT